MEPKQAPKNDTHLMSGVLGIARNLFGLFLSRVELAALELSEVRATVLKLLAVVALGMIAAWFALAYWSALLVYLAWDSMGWKILLLVAIGFSLITVAVVFYARAVIARGSLSLPATMNELRNDRDALL